MEIVLDIVLQLIVPVLVVICVLFLVGLKFKDVINDRSGEK
jgi:hypothetical protein